MAGFNHLARRVLLVALAACAPVFAGCAGLEPWVKPYERERLADPAMNANRDLLMARHRAHVFEVREAGRGATSATGGGCGCN